MSVAVIVGEGARHRSASRPRPNSQQDLGLGGYLSPFPGTTIYPPSATRRHSDFWWALIHERASADVGFPVVDFRGLAPDDRGFVVSGQESADVESWVVGIPADLVEIGDPLPHSRVELWPFGRGRTIDGGAGLRLEAFLRPDERCREFHHVESEVKGAGWWCPSSMRSLPMVQCALPDGHRDDHGSSRLSGAR